LTVYYVAINRQLQTRLLAPLEKRKSPAPMLVKPTPMNNVSRAGVTQEDERSFHFRLLHPSW